MILHSGNEFFETYSSFSQVTKQFLAHIQGYSAVCDRDYCNHASPRHVILIPKIFLYVNQIESAKLPFEGVWTQTREIPAQTFDNFGIYEPYLCRGGSYLENMGKEEKQARMHACSKPNRR